MKFKGANNENKSEDDIVTANSYNGSNSNSTIMEKCLQLLQDANDFDNPSNCDNYQNYTNQNESDFQAQNDFNGEWSQFNYPPQEANCYANTGYYGYPVQTNTQQGFHNAPTPAYHDAQSYGEIHGSSLQNPNNAPAYETESNLAYFDQVTYDTKYVNQSSYYSEADTTARVTPEMDYSNNNDSYYKWNAEPQQYHSEQQTTGAHMGGDSFINGQGYYNANNYYNQEGVTTQNHYDQTNDYYSMQSSNYNIPMSYY